MNRLTSLPNNRELAMNRLTSLPNNREQVMNRLTSLRRTSDKKPDMKRHFIDFTHKMLDNDQAKPPLGRDKERWYLPIFGVYHPQEPESIHFDLVEAHADAEIRPDVTAFATKVPGAQIGSHRFERFTSWKALNRVTARLIHVARSFHEGADNTSCRGWHDCNKPCSTSELLQAKTAIIHCVQKERLLNDLNVNVNVMKPSKRI
jgi:hypothetical protein